MVESLRGSSTLLRFAARDALSFLTQHAEFARRVLQSRRCSQQSLALSPLRKSLIRWFRGDHVRRRLAVRLSRYTIRNSDPGSA
jgi:hypothetical protein